MTYFNFKALLNGPAHIKSPLCVFWYFFVLFFISLLVFPSSRLEAVVGDEEINPARIAEMERKQEELMKQEEETKEGQEKRADLVKILEEKRKSLEEGSTEEKLLGEEIMKLKSQYLQQKKTWRDRLKILPLVRTDYDSNIRNQKVAKSDIIFHVGSGVQADLSAQRADIKVEYKGEHVDYKKNHKLSRFEHELGTRFHYPVSSKTDVDAGYRLTSTGNQTSEVRGILKRLRQDANLTLNQRLSKKTGIRIDQTYSDVFFTGKSNRSDSSSQYTFSPELDYYLSRKTSFFGRYVFGSSGGGTGGSNKSTANEFRGGIRGQVAPKTTALLDFGISRQHQTQARTNNNAFVAEAILISNVTRKSRIEFTMNRSFAQAVQTEGSSFYITDNFRLTGTTQFRRYFQGALMAGVRRNQYDQSGRISGSSQRDLTLELSPMLRYDFMKWLSLELRYLFSTVSATESLREYTKHLFSVTLIGRY